MKNGMPVTLVSSCDAVVVATSIDLNRIVKIDKPKPRVCYDLQETGSSNLKKILADFDKKHHLF